MNVILEKTDQVPYFTNMRQVLEALNLSASDFDWFISDIETSYYGNDFQPQDQWMSGTELNRFLSANDVQFIWAVFSAVPKGMRPVFEEAPYIDGNPDYWTDRDISPQLPGALFEIACWDSSATILVGVPDHAIGKFVQAYPDTKPLRQRVDAGIRDE